MSENKTDLPWWNADGVDEPGDDIPELTDEMLARADVYHKGKLVRKMGRPVSENKKVSISIRLDRDIVERFKATGKGWQTRLNDSLRKVMPV